MLNISNTCGSCPDDATPTTPADANVDAAETTDAPAEATPEATEETPATPEAAETPEATV
jgi:hypothetical protein